MWVHFGMHLQCILVYCFFFFFMCLLPNIIIISIVYLKGSFTFLTFLMLMLMGSQPTAISRKLAATRWYQTNVTPNMGDGSGRKICCPREEHAQLSSTECSGDDCLMEQSNGFTIRQLCEQPDGLTNSLKWERKNK